MQRVSGWFSNKKQTAAFFGVSVQALDGWISRGCPLERDGRALKFYLPEVVAWRLERETAEAGTLEEERTRLTKEQADKTEIENRKLRGELVPVTETAKLLERVVVSFRSRVLSIPTKCAPLVHGCNTLAETRDEIEKSLYDALNELAELDVSTLGDTAGSADGGATAKTDGKRVGRQVSKTKRGKQRRTRTVADK